ncbi:probable receptor-like serine/threonine-protein kinase At5g57670 isoform X3 [Brachypodium distachyon]|uniref:probable receptor-like serine/threonine-protein kinase At5g57670 isoform X3 n=1 Tax=Brachypodium distachyon TaxID=15368 RepID=UPI000D0D72D6|nr:probable receptor-like serine/threonine-protein kinase At5g57670 isoform X3 [Brachypodium distachyon]|eukprot:XP_024317793.1 probable receptor-like serine/threonine-protein kinase At5g57670 isoform X3 [Brachypodium distachyon]
MKPLYSRGRDRFKKLLLSIAKPTAHMDMAHAAEPLPGAPPDSPPGKPAWRCFSYDEIHRATNGFHGENLVGKGGSSEVYRGTLEDGAAVAVKRLMGAAACERRERDFLAELGTVGHARHPNVCALLGCCVDRDLYLVFAFSARGSVSAILHDGAAPAMGWEARYGIAVGTARGLEYLHKGCRRRIIHRDIKASNVLLTDDFQPQISDFGLAKWLPTEWTHRAIAPIEGAWRRSTTRTGSWTRRRTCSRSACSCWRSWPGGSRWTAPTGASSAGWWSCWKAPRSGETGGLCHRRRRRATTRRSHGASTTSTKARTTNLTRHPPLQPLQHRPLSI